ncbi:MAG: PqiC family protein [Chitinispirillaceae bacterium]|nr:PqiC family protein [Chitinispirillaceae bacterium]
MKCLIKYLLLLLLIAGCTNRVPIKQYYIINYTPSPSRDRLNPDPYPYTIRINELEIEEAYRRPQIVYRQSPFLLKYYVYHLWAVKPERMITDVFYKHLISATLVSNVTRRLDEITKPDYEIKGIIEAIEEYDSDELWFAHVALRINLIRVKDGKVLYSRRFDHRKRVNVHTPEHVVRELSSLIEYIFTQAIYDFDAILSSEFGLIQPKEREEKQEKNMEIIIPTSPVDSAVIEEQ